MIIYPKKWRLKYEDLLCVKSIDVDIPMIVNILTNIITNINVKHLAYSGGIDSTIMLCLMSRLFDDVSTYTISIRKDHPDIIYARIGSSFYKSNHHEFIVNPQDDHSGDNAVRKLFANASTFTQCMVCCDGIDEFMCGYYKHMEQNDLDTYERFLSRLLPDHLIPLDKNSKNIKVYLPYLGTSILNIFRNISLNKKVDSKNRKKVVCDIARYLGIPESIISRNKYGFCDAFKISDK